MESEKDNKGAQVNPAKNRGGDTSCAWTNFIIKERQLKHCRRTGVCPIELPESTDIIQRSIQQAKEEKALHQIAPAPTVGQMEAKAMKDTLDDVLTQGHTEIYPRISRYGDYLSSYQPLQSDNEPVPEPTTEISRKTIPIYETVQVATPKKHKTAKSTKSSGSTTVKTTKNTPAKKDAGAPTSHEPVAISTKIPVTGGTEAMNSADIAARAAQIRKMAHEQAMRQARAMAARQLADKIIASQTTSPATTNINTVVGIAPMNTQMFVNNGSQTKAGKRVRDGFSKFIGFAKQGARNSAKAMGNININIKPAKKVDQAKQAKQIKEAQPIEMMQFAPVSAKASSILRTVAATAGSAPNVPSTPNALERLASSKVTFSFKFNWSRFGAVMRYISVVVIVITISYLAWDTYSTNKTIRNNFAGTATSSAMSIAGANPATADQTAVSEEQKQTYAVPADQARFIKIPKINVNARVLGVGVNSRGHIDTPTNLNDTAWYDGSAKPGQDGQVFIDGHTSFSSSIPAAFNDLPKIVKGDKITVERGDGKLINYTVVETKTVAADQVDMVEALNPPKNHKRGLTLMTCTGIFNYRTQTSDKRFVVYAVEDKA